MRQFFFLQLTGDKNGFGTTNLCDQDVDHLENKIQETFEDRFTAKKICDDKAIVNLAYISRKRIKVGLQYLEIKISCLMEDINTLIKELLYL